MPHQQVCVCVKERESESRPEKEAPNDPLVTWVVCNSDGGAKTPEICNRRERERLRKPRQFSTCARTWHSTVCWRWK